VWIFLIFRHFWYRPLHLGEVHEGIQEQSNLMIGALAKSIPLKIVLQLTNIFH